MARRGAPGLQAGVRCLGEREHPGLSAVAAPSDRGAHPTQCEVGPNPTGRNPGAIMESATRPHGAVLSRPWTSAGALSTAASPMLSLDDPDADVDLRALHTPGGFVWWYAEVMDGAGNGVVLIWSFGLPFLPGTRAQPTPAWRRPAIHVAAYQAGRESLYALHEVSPDRAVWQPRRGGSTERWRFGDSVIETHRTGDRTELMAQLAVPVVGGVVRGSLRLHGPTARWLPTGRGPSSPGGTPAAELASHRWTPMVGAACATALLRCGEALVAVNGRGYHDRNASVRPLHRLGIGRWLWGRWALEDEDRAVYALWPVDGGPAIVLGYTLGADGVIRDQGALDLKASGWRLSRWGLTWARQIAIQHRDAPASARSFGVLRVRHRVDDGPFYQRQLCEAEGGHGTLETIAPGRIDLAPLRALVRMRVSHAVAPGSRWLALFEGPRRGRWRRLLRHWLSRWLRPTAAESR